MRWIALTIGFTGSLHCILMCAPLFIMMNQKSGSGKKFIAYRGMYNMGRITTYCFMGLILGASQQLFSIHQYQETLSITFGGILLATVVAPRRYRIFAMEQSKIMVVLSWLRKTMLPLLGGNRWEKHFILGVLNGFLPCGFVYMGLGYAALSGSMWNAAETMMYFGFGTLPAMLGVALCSQFFQPLLRWNAAFRRLLPVAVVLIALLCITRGLSLDIPYLSPELHAQPGGIEQGCSPAHGQQTIIR